MKTIEETEKEKFDRLQLMAENKHSDWDLSDNDELALKWAVEKIKAIDQVVSIATKEAVERERARYIEKIIDSPLTSDFIEYINNKYFPPQQEGGNNE